MSDSRGGSGCLWVVIGLVVLAALAFFFTPFGMLIGIPIQMARIRAVERRMQRPEIYLPAATNLALYCQSVEDLHLTNWLGASRLPQPLPALGSPRAIFETNHAIVEFGGGFYHYGYRVHLEDSSSTTKPWLLHSAPHQNVWELSLCREGQPEKLLHRFTLDASARVSVAAFTGKSLAEYNRRLLKSPADVQLHQAKIALLLKYDPSQARAACLEAEKALPTHWWPRLTLALLDFRNGRFAQASAELVKFTESNPSYSRYIYLAYFYQLVHKPDEAAQAMEKAVSYPVIDLPDDDMNTECRGYSAAVYAFRNQKYATVIKLCNALIPVRENGDYAKGALLDLKTEAERALEGAKSNFTPSQSVIGFDPYERMEIGSSLYP